MPHVNTVADEGIVYFLDGVPVSEQTYTYDNPQATFTLTNTGTRNLIWNVGGYTEITVPPGTSDTRVMPTGTSSFRLRAQYGYQSFSMRSEEITVVLPTLAGISALKADKTDLNTTNATLADITKKTQKLFYAIMYTSNPSDPVQTTADLTKLFNDVSAINGGEIIFNSNQEYKINNVINCPLIAGGDVEIKGKNATIHLTSNIKYLYTGVLSIGSQSPGIKIKIENLNSNLDGVTQDWNNAHPNGGRGALFLQGKTITVRNCNFQDVFYSAAIWTHYGENILIENCNGVRVGGRSLDNTEDARGDAFYLGYLGGQDSANPKKAVATIRNCIMQGYDVVEDQSTYNSSHQGRIGVTIENCATGVPKEVLVENSYFYNFNRNIHVETTDTVNLSVKNTYFDQFGLGVWIFNNKHVDSLSLDNCTFNRTKNVGVMPGGVTNQAGGQAIASNTVTGGTMKTKLTNCNFNINYYQEAQLFSFIDNLVMEGGSIHSNQDIRWEFSDNVRFKNVEFVFKNVLKAYNSPSSYDDCSFACSDYSLAGWLNLSSDSAYTKKSHQTLKRCKLTNLYIKPTGNAGITYTLDNCEMTVDNNFKGDYAKYLISFADGKPNRVINSRFYNKSTSQVDLFESGASALVDGFRCQDNYIEDLRMKVFSSVKPIYVERNYMKYIQNLGYSFFIDTYNSKSFLTENTFEYDGTVVTTIAAPIANKANALNLQKNYSFQSNNSIYTEVV